MYLKILKKSYKKVQIFYQKGLIIITITHSYFDIFTKRQISVFVFNFDPYSTNWSLTYQVKIMTCVS